MRLAASGTPCCVVGRSLQRWSGRRARRGGHCSGALSRQPTCRSRWRASGWSSAGVSTKWPSRGPGSPPWLTRSVGASSATCTTAPSNAWVSIGLALRHAQHQLGADADEAKATLDEAVVEISAAIEDLRELAHGLRPALLQAGLGPALRDLASRSPVPVEVSATTDRFAPDVEAAAYFVASEGLTNAVKHARADQVVLQVARQNSTLVVSVADDGVGGAAVERGSGLTGLSDRVAARGGRLRIESARGHGTTLIAELPCAS